MSFFRCRYLHFILILISLLFISLVVSCKKNDKKVEPENEAVSEVVNETAAGTDSTSDNTGESFYNPYDDTAARVDSMMERLEEERIASQLSEMEESYSEYQLEDIQYEEAEPDDSESLDSETDDLDGSEGKEKIFLGKKNEMRFFEFNNETLSPQYTKDGLVVVHSSDGNVSRNFYDKSYYLVKKEEWRITSAADAKLLKTERYFYSDKNHRVTQKEIESDNFLEIVQYSDFASPLISKKYILKDDEQYIVMDRYFVYDEQNRILRDEKLEYTYNPEDYEIIEDTISKKYEYVYNEGDIPPDSVYYENGIVKIRYKYSTEKGTYVCWIYFDQNLSVKTYYENELRVRDEFYNNDKIFRTKVYEKAAGEEK